MESQDILAKLISFPTISAESNIDLIHYVQGLLTPYGITTQLYFNKTQQKASLFASVGPENEPGLLFSGHSDVVPVSGQHWTKSPFTAVIEDQRVYGRGSCDMKGFIAVALQTLIESADKPLKRPLQLALSYDEEVGCLGVRDMLAQLSLPAESPYLTIVGEPTDMDIALGHKGKTAYRAHCHGEEAHSSRAPLSVNAIYLACELIHELRQLQSRLTQSGAHDKDYDVPFSTVHVGTIEGGKALNIVPNYCQFDFEIRHLPADQIPQKIAALKLQIAEIVALARVSHPQSKAAIELELLADYPGLEMNADHEAIQLLTRLAPSDTQLIKVAFGTEAGLFSQRFDTPVVVCGPGSIQQAHKPDEYVSLAQLNQCHTLLTTLVQHMCMH